MLPIRAPMCRKNEWEEFNWIPKSDSSHFMILLPIKVSQNVQDTDSVKQRLRWQVAWWKGIRHPKVQTLGHLALLHPKSMPCAPWIKMCLCWPRKNFIIPNFILRIQGFLHFCVQSEPPNLYSATSWTKPAFLGTQTITLIKNPCPCAYQLPIFPPTLPPPFPQAWPWTASSSFVCSMTQTTWCHALSKQKLCPFSINPPPLSPICN